MISGKAKLTGVIGCPVRHSLSPALHNYWLENHNIDGVYVPLEVAPEYLTEAIAGVKALGFAGVNLTIPHKETAMELCDEVTDVAQHIGAVNTLIISDGKITGTNTDAFGFIENLRAHVGDLTPYLAHCLILGAGGAARAVIVGLQQADVQKITLCNRTMDKAQSLAKEFSCDVTPWDERNALNDVTLLVNTTSLGMQGQPTLELSLETLPRSSLVTDIVYTPLQTELLKVAVARGNPTVDGLGMLLCQAQEGFAHWFGTTPDVDEATREQVLKQVTG